VNITVIGTGYVGLVTGACFAEMGNNVVCVDTDAAKVSRLRLGDIPIHEPGLAPLVARNAEQGRLRFESMLTRAVRDVDVFIIAVGTPPAKDGSADTSAVIAAAREIGRLVEGDALVVGKSTVRVGTGDKVRHAIDDELAKRRSNVRMRIASNPEFLKEGAAIEDFMRPDRVIVGTDDDEAVEILRELYAPITRNHERMIVMGMRDAEMTKYAANAMLATRISFMNEISSICESYGVDIENVRRGIGSDRRIGYSFIYAGCGYGGSCFPKDIKSIVHMARSAGQRSELLEAVEARNEVQKRLLARKIIARFGEDLRGRTIALWGLAFKPGTDDMREAPALVLIHDLVQAGASVTAHDPIAIDVAKSMIPPEWLAEARVQFSEHQYRALEGADALALVTEWKPFRQPDFREMKRRMRGHAIFDGRNQYDPMQVRRHGFEYYGIGRPEDRKQVPRHRNGEQQHPGSSAASSAPSRLLADFSCR